MSIGVWGSKHPSGTTTRAIDFALRLAAGETLTGTPTASITLLDGPSATPLVASTVSIDGTRVKVKLTAGAADAHYEVFLQASTSAGLTVEDCAEITVEDC